MRRGVRQQASGNTGQLIDVCMYQAQAAGGMIRAPGIRNPVLAKPARWCRAVLHWGLLHVRIAGPAAAEPQPSCPRLRQSRRNRHCCCCSAQAAPRPAVLLPAQHVAAICRPAGSPPSRLLICWNLQLPAAVCHRGAAHGCPEANLAASRPAASFPPAGHTCSSTHLGGSGLGHHAHAAGSHARSGGLGSEALR